jgi:hypothetical protein
MTAAVIDDGLLPAHLFFMAAPLAYSAETSLVKAWHTVTIRLERPLLKLLDNISLLVSANSSSSLFQATARRQAEERVAVLLGPVMPVVISVVNLSVVSFAFDMSAGILVDALAARRSLSVRVCLNSTLFSLCNRQPLGVELPIRMFIQLSEAQTASQTTSAVVSTLSAVSLNPTAAVQLARVSALSEISACVVAAGDTPLDFASGSFTSMTIGSSRGKYLRGAVVGNTLVIIGGSVILLAVVVVWIIFETAKSAALHRPPGLVSLLGKACEVGRIPSVYFPVFMVFAAPILTFSVSLLSLVAASSAPGGDTANFGIGLTGLLISVSYSSALTFLLLRCFSCVLEEQKLVSSRRSGIGAPARWLIWLCRPDRKWVSTAPELNPWRRRHRLVFDDYNRSWYALTDLWSTVLVGIIGGVDVSSTTVCAAQVGVLLLLYVVVFLLGVFLDPAMNRSLRFYINVSNFAGVLSSSMLVAAIRTDNPQLLDASNYLLMFMSFVALVKLIVDVLYVLYRFLRSLEVSSSCQDEDELLGAPMLHQGAAVLVISSQAPSLPPATTGGTDVPGTQQSVLRGLPDDLDFLGAEKRSHTTCSSLALDEPLISSADTGVEGDDSRRARGAGDGGALVDFERLLDILPTSSLGETEKVDDLFVAQLDSATDLEKFLGLPRKPQPRIPVISDDLETRSIPPLLPDDEAFEL